VARFNCSVSLRGGGGGGGGVGPTAEIMWVFLPSAAANWREIKLLRTTVCEIVTNKSLKLEVEGAYLFAYRLTRFPTTFQCRKPRTQNLKVTYHDDR
jgi:hypothetical protein